MTDTKPEKTTPRAGSKKRQHVAVEVNGGIPQFTDVVVFGQEIDALRHIIGQTGWKYVAVAHGESVAEALKAAAA